MQITRSTEVYYPMAITDSKSIMEQNLYISDGMTDLDKALNQFSIWEEHYGYKIIDAWIDIYDCYGHTDKIGRFKVKKVWEITEHIEVGDDEGKEMVRPGV